MLEHKEIFNKLFDIACKELEKKLEEELIQEKINEQATEQGILLEEERDGNENAN